MNFIGGWYVILTSGDGAGATLVPGDLVHARLHETICSCEKAWDECKSEGVTETIREIDIDENWSRDYPDYLPGMMELLVGEDRLDIIRLSDVSAAGLPHSAAALNGGK